MSVLASGELGIAIFSTPLSTIAIYADCLATVDIDDIFSIIFESETQASIAIAHISGFAPIPSYEFRWFYRSEIPVPKGTPQHRAILVCDGCFWVWKKIADAADDEPWITSPTILEGSYLLAEFTGDRRE